MKIKELGLEEGHPEKEGVLVDLTSLIPEVKTRLARKNSGTSAESEAFAGLAQKLEGVDVKADTTGKTADAGI